MPPRKGILKSGNAGNSSKVGEQTAVVLEGEKRLFPPGSKYPLSLLHERRSDNIFRTGSDRYSDWQTDELTSRCQKLGWEKPVVDVRQLPGGWSFVVGLSRVNKKTSEKETIRLQPNPPHLRPTSLEARHWGATYALHRFCNHLQLHLVLPPGPRDYWNELAAQHKNSPPHMKWMYESDPFAVQKARAPEERQDVAERESASGRLDKSRILGVFSQAPEVKMAASLRELVENAIKKGIASYPEASGVRPFILAEADILKVTQQLKHLGFTTVQIRNAVNFLSQPSALASHLLNSSSELEACIEYLILHVPECDLPQHFLPSINSSNPLITSIHPGMEDFGRRRVEDKAINEAGWPAHAVKACTANPKLLENWDLLMLALGKILIGEEWEDVSDITNDLLPYDLNTDELDALGISVSDPTQLIMPLFTAPIQVHILTSSNKGFPRPGYSPLYITSSLVPPYIRLHLLSQILVAMKADDFIEPGEGFCMAIMRFLEGEWAKIEDNGPPETSIVLKHFAPEPRATSVDQGTSRSSDSFNSGSRRRHDPSSRDGRDDQQIKQEFEALCRTKKYSEMLSVRRKLPAFAAKADFLQQLKNSRVVVVVGETGSGKTTQLPQFILDSLILSSCGSKTSILITQPRRISAISVAMRVSSERLEDGSVGYAIRGESRKDKKTKLLFCTTGVLLRRLGSGDELREVSHVVVDEVHERSVDGDFLLLELKELLKRHSSLKVILMSATINYNSFIKYFNGAPLLTIPGNAHPVIDRYLEDIIPLIPYRASAPRSGQNKNERASWDDYKSLGLDDSCISTIESIIWSDRIDFQLIAAVVDYILSTVKGSGGILIFLPGVQEIRQCIDAIRLVTADKQADIYPLHANLSSDEQRRVFNETSRWKIVVATNVAETSITINDVIYVIDSGKVKETRYDPNTNLSRLVETWITRAAAKQRRGRAGRTQPGVCYKLYTQKQESDMGEFPVPEIFRVPLEKISLTVKAMREDEDVKLFLSKAIDPPETKALERAASVLQEIGAIDDMGQLTPLGRHISLLPMDLRLAKMLILSTIFQCLGPVLTVAAILSSKPLFFNPMEKREESTEARKRFSMGESDLLTDLKAFDECMRLRSEGATQSALKKFCEDNFISVTTVREVDTLRNEFIHSLEDLGFIPPSSAPSTPTLNENSNSVNLLKAVILGGLWPHVARVHLPEHAIKFDKVQAGTIRRENTAREFKVYDINDGRVFLHPASVLFGKSVWKSSFLVYFHKYMSSKVFLRDATEVPLYGLLLFGGAVSVDQIKGGLTIGNKVRLKAWPRIGILVNQLRGLLNAHLGQCIEDGMALSASNNPVLDAMLALLINDGLTE